MVRNVCRQFGRRFAMLITLLLVASAVLVATPQPAAAEGQQIVYSGQMTTQVALTNVYGQPVGSQAYQTNVVIIFEAPRQGWTRETNPFSIVIQSTPLANAPGEISLYSSMVYNNTLFQYWDYQWDGATFSGTLTNNHAAEALALNLFTLPTEIYPGFWMPYTQALANGTQMTGTFDQQGNLSVRIAGNITNGTAPFVTNIVATRTS